LFGLKYLRHIRPDEDQTSLAYFFVIAVLAAGVSPILAYACSLLGGRGNLAGWRWIFVSVSLTVKGPLAQHLQVIEGLITLVSGIITWLFIPDFPDQNKFLTAEQTALVLRRIDQDRGDAVPDDFTRKKVRKHILDWKIWAYGNDFKKKFIY
jgi:hypothetical protein